MKHFCSKSGEYFFIGVVALFLLLLAGSGYAQDEEAAKYPNRPVTFIQPFSAGAPADLTIRLVSKEAEKSLGQTIIVVNKPGGSGTIGVAAIASAKPDGYTIGNAPHSPMFVVPHLEKVPYHPVKDIRMIAQFAAFNMGVSVRSDSPIKSFQDLIDFARQNPKKLTYGTAGANSMQFIIMEQIAKREKVQITHIPYKSTAESQTALLGGHILFAAGDFNYPLIEAKQIRLVVLFREESKEQYPGVPALKDLGYDFPTPMPMCVAGPKGIPEGIVKKLEEAYTKAVKAPAFIKGMKEDLHLPIVYRNSKELAEYTANHYEAYGKILKEMGLTK
ncbi:MAG: hypothetical protein A2162_06505 [Deltaproteobacteria bacterium RBG_13_52_11b]|nr:MAG: hypothetical protein A2162_06505 [Deltaproteobacteria bacterium RBG_13_52_11b]